MNAAGDPVLAAPVSAQAVNVPDVMFSGGVQAGSNSVTFSKASGLLVVRQQLIQDTTMQSDSESGEPAA